MAGIVCAMLFVSAPYTVNAARSVGEAVEPRLAKVARTLGMGPGRTLFDAFRGPHFTLLAVGTDAELPSLDPDVVHVHRIDAYEPYGKGLFLVRPDGYIGWAGEDATGLTDYLARC